VRVTGLGWAGTRTPSFDGMAEFVESVLGLEPQVREPGIAVYSLPDGDRFEIFSPGHSGGGHPEGAVMGFTVDDVEAARDELVAAGCEVGEVRRGSSGAGWLYFRAPDGNWYQLTSSH
jgi:catechol 2,3-dioxygenase-like lactoylglutathione lyase family enzyme